MNDFTRSAVRTIVPIIVGWALSLPIVQTLGFTEAELTQAATAAVIGLYYLIGRVVEVFFPQIGRVMLGGFGAPTYGRHEAGRPDGDGGYSRAHVLVILAAGAVVCLAAVAVGASSADAHRRPLPYVGITVACIEPAGVLSVRWTSADLSGRDWRPRMDDGSAFVELHHLGAGAGPGGSWVVGRRLAAGEHHARVALSGEPTWDAVRVVLGGVPGGVVRSVPVVLPDRCVPELSR